MTRMTFDSHATGWVGGSSFPLRGHFGYRQGRTSLSALYSKLASMGRPLGSAECGPPALSQPPAARAGGW
eukprot:2079639-Alexandrium_andersonii.AAC.1